VANAAIECGICTSNVDLNSKQEIAGIPYCELSCVWSCRVGTWGNGPEISRTFLNVRLEKDRGDQLDRWSEKRRSVTESEGRGISSTEEK